MKRKAKKNHRREAKKTYAHFGFRPTPEAASRIIKLAGVMSAKQQRRVTKSEVMITCLMSKLPELESKYGI